MGMIRWVNDKVEDEMVLHHNKTLAILVLLLALFLLALTNIIIEIVKSLRG